VAHQNKKTLWMAHDGRARAATRAAAPPRAAAACVQKLLDAEDSLAASCTRFAYRRVELPLLGRSHVVVDAPMGGRARSIWNTMAMSRSIGGHSLMTGHRSGISPDVIDSSQHHPQRRVLTNSRKDRRNHESLSRIVEGDVLTR